MKNKRFFISLISCALISVIILGAASCGTFRPRGSLTDDITPQEIPVEDIPISAEARVTDVALRLFNSANESGENTLISPLSVICAMAMTSNGADGETLSQMESVLGLTVEELNMFIHSYLETLPQSEKYKLSLANSIWFIKDEGFDVKRDFLQACVDYYDAGIYETDFDDHTLKDINAWVENKTDGMIEKVLDEIPEYAVMYLINALAFEADWATPYSEDRVWRGSFALADGSSVEVEYMSSEESQYLEDEDAVGFIKYYADRKYAFVALLPNEDTSVEKYISSLDGQKLNEMLSNALTTSVLTTMPKFETEYSIELSDAFKLMGMTAPFDQYSADFSKLGESSVGNIYINRVIHKTFIQVGEKGTRAGAVTAVEMNTESAMEYNKEVCLNRPFVYMLIDCENNIPFFIGTMMNPG